MREAHHRRRAGFVTTLAACAFALALGATVAVGTTSARAAGGGTPQASITLNNSAATLAQWNSTDWTLAKNGSLGSDGSTANWTVTTTKGATSASRIGVFGYISVTNTGSGPATIGNVVVNLQKKSGNAWTSASSDVADAANGDLYGTTGNPVPSICSPASSESKSFFTENSASGPLNFIDTSSNTIFAISPQVTLAPGATVNLGYSAYFDNSVLQIPAGTSLRSEFIVTFGNAGARGGSGATCQNLDINGNGVSTDPGEASVRSVPSRITGTLPLVTPVNASVTLSDTDPPDITTTGTVTYTGSATDIGGGSGTATLSDSASDSVTASGVDGGTDGGTISNCAHLNGDGLTVTVSGFTFTVVPAVDLRACSTLAVGAATLPALVTYTQGAYRAKPAGSNPASQLNANFTTLYPGPAYLTVGGGFTMTFTSQSAIRAYSPSGPPAALNASVTNPVTTSSGIFGGQVLALKVNVDFSAAGITPSGFGSVLLCHTGTSLDGQSVSGILAAMNTALGGGALPSGYTVSQLNDLATSLNESFDNGNESGWAAASLCP